MTVCDQQRCHLCGRGRTRSVKGVLGDSSENFSFRDACPPNALSAQNRDLAEYLTELEVVLSGVVVEAWNVDRLRGWRWVRHEGTSRCIGKEFWFDAQG